VLTIIITYGIMVTHNINIGSLFNFGGYMQKFILSSEQLDAMLKNQLIRFGAVPNVNDNRPSTLEDALSLFALSLHERESQDGSAVERICEHLTTVAAERNAPFFDAICLWSYCPLSASIALARTTPSVWDRLGEEVRVRLNFMMEMFTYLEAFATADCNNYKTGPGLSGNYSKNWNPNYRLANVPVMVFAACFFGEGDLKKGEQAVNTLLNSFDSDVYEKIIARLDEYGWDRAKAIWTTPARVHEDGTEGKSAKEVLINGGETYSLDYTHSYVTKDAGTGLGVSCGKQGYFYSGFPLSNPTGIVEALLDFNYSGGAVKSEHYFDVNNDGVAERIAWILDGSHSPYENQIGMMKEFASGNRSSAGYCSHDFLLSTCLIAASKSLGFYNAEGNPELWGKIKVGNRDFLYKNEVGYQGFATGSYGKSTKIHSEENEGAAYFAMKYLWQNAMDND